MVDILLADDQPQVRSALRLLLEQEDQVRIVGEAENAMDLLEQTREVHPHTILVDWELPGLPSSRRLSAVRQTYPGARIIALSSHPEAFAHQFERLGLLYCVSGDTINGRRYLRDSIKLQPDRESAVRHLEQSLTNPKEHRQHILENILWNVDGITLFF